MTQGESFYPVVVKLVLRLCSLAITATRAEIDDLHPGLPVRGERAHETHALSDRPGHTDRRRYHHPRQGILAPVPMAGQLRGDTRRHGPVDLRYGHHDYNDNDDERPEFEPDGHDEYDEHEQP